MDDGSRRAKDTSMKSLGARVTTTVYKCEITTPDKAFRTSSWLDDDGVSRRITVNAPLGSLDVRLK